ncbi:MAG TPA: MFS transporter [Polyangiaceae bacterium]|nr:MFS transporter [Polyangiaceae bacterium]
MIEAPTGTGLSPRAADPPWLTRMIWGVTGTSFLSDLGHEAQSTLLPTFMAALGLPPAALGIVEGVADATSSFVKLGAGWLSDHLGRRKPFVVASYLATGLSSGFIALASGFPLVLVAKIFGWFGRGVRSPLRNAMLADAVPESARGRAFGFHRFGDTLGAVLGPALAVALLASSSGGLATVRQLLWWALVPGVLSAVTFAVFVSEQPRARREKEHSLGLALRQMPSRFRRYLLGVGIFGAGDFARSMLILAASQLLTPSWGPLQAASIGGALYVVHNIVCAAAAYPAGVLADRLGHQRVLGWGYTLSVLVPLSLAAFFVWHIASVPLLAAVFVISGFVLGVQDTLEDAATGMLAPESERGLAFGLLGATNGMGDLLSSAIVGALWTAYPALGFGYSAALMALGALVTLRMREANG